MKQLNLSFFEEKETTVDVRHGDCKEKLKELIEKGIKVDSIVTDPPYELGFMGKSWDSTGVAYDQEMWKLCLSVLKPGGHLLAFGGSRTYHRMTCAIEDAGFEIRDQIMWIYGQGFPKSLNVSKAIDKMAGAEREVVGLRDTLKGNGGEGNNFLGDAPRLINITAPSTDAAKQWEGWGSALKPAHEPICMARKPLEKGLNIAQNVLEHGTGGINVDGCRVGTSGAQAKTGTLDNKSLGCYGNGLNGTGLRVSLDQGRFPANLIHDGSEEVMEEFAKQSKAMGMHSAGSTKKFSGRENTDSIFGIGGKSDSLERFGDSGSAARFFKETPYTEEDIAHEPICMARKPLSEKTIAENVLEHGTGALNIDGCRIEGTKPLRENTEGYEGMFGMGSRLAVGTTTQGRFPANLIHDGSDAVEAEFAKYGERKSGGKKDVVYPRNTRGNNIIFSNEGNQSSTFAGESGTAARFFYSAKASKKDRCGSKHPTVKPISLMRYLCLLVTPPDGTVLDPFAGTGTTGQAAREEGFNAILIERDAEYFEDIKRRVSSEES